MQLVGSLGFVAVDEQTGQLQALARAELFLPLVHDGLT